MDTFIADLAYAIGAFGIKAGAPTQKVRAAKYERLIEIEKETTKQKFFYQHIGLHFLQGSPGVQINHGDQKPDEPGTFREIFHGFSKEAKTRSFQSPLCGGIGFVCLIKAISILTGRKVASRALMPNTVGS